MDISRLNKHFHFDFVSVHVSINLFLHRFRNKLARSLTIFFSYVLTSILNFQL